MEFENLNKIKEAFFRKEYNKGFLKEANLWSSVSLIGSKLMIDKHVGKDDVEKEKRELLECIVKHATLHFEKIDQRLEEIKNALISCRYNVKRVEIKALSKALVGTSETFGKLPFEVGLYFDPIINVPYIPGSTIKGAVSSATYDLLFKTKFQEIIKQTSEELAKKEAEKYAKQECRRIFGGVMEKDQSEGVGLVGFTDAYPVKAGNYGFLLYPDVMTPHYTDKIETELDVTPKPITYLTIAPGTKFRFFMFYKRRRKERELRPSDFASQPTRDQLGIIDRGLLYAFIRGVGAKTTLGYSIFEILSYEEVS